MAVLAPKSPDSGVNDRHAFFAELRRHHRRREHVAALLAGRRARHQGTDRVIHLLRTRRGGQSG